MSERNLKTIRKFVHGSARKIKDVAAREVHVLEDRHAKKIADECGCTVHDVYHEALKEGVCPYRYVRNREGISIEEQLVLAESRVAVIGAGGLGGYVILQLARLGIGQLVVVDHDVFDETNLNRQVLSSGKALNKSKAAEAAAPA